MFKRTLTVSLGSLVCVSALLAQEPARPAAKLDLTPESLANLHALIRPQEHEWRLLHVHWITDMVAARKKAAAEDKPVFIPRLSYNVRSNTLGAC